MSQPLSELDLFDTAITEDSITNIIRHLPNSLIKLDVSESESQSDNFIEYLKLQELKSISRLKVLNCYSLHSDEISSLRKQMPQLSINTEDLKIAQPNQCLSSDEGLWEVKVQQIQVFH